MLYSMSDDADALLRAANAVQQKLQTCCTTIDVQQTHMLYSKFADWLCRICVQT